MEWIEVAGPSVEVAIEAAMAELGAESAEDLEIEVLQEAERGLFGGVKREAIIRARRRAAKKGRRRRGRGKGGGGTARSGESEGQRGRESRERRPERSARESRPTQERRRKDEGAARPKQQRDRSERAEPRQAEREEAETVDLDTQRVVVHEFLEGLLGAFNLEGTVESEIVDDRIHARVTGPQTEGLVGPKGTVLQAILELCRTIVQRQTQAGARINLDIGGYSERRREALRIYAGRLAERVLEEGGEIMLEPMNAAERKVVHDAIVEIDGVRSYSEGEDPERSVVIAPAEADPVSE